jgi:DNA gyrase subunit A
VILLALDKGRPRTFTLREMLVSFKDHRFEVIRRRTTYLLKKALERIHILEGLRKALDAIDDVVDIIRKSPDTDTARTALMKRLTITERQADAILDMRLARLTGLEQKKLDEELGGLRKEATDYRDILARDERVNGIIKSELLEMKKKYGDERRTKIEAGEAEEIDIESLIKEETVIVTVSHEGYVKRSPIDTYRSQHRGGKGITGAATKEGDFVERVFTASTHDYLLCFTDKGRVFWLKVYAIPEMSRTARGRALPNLIRLLPNEIVNEIVPITGEFDETRELVMATSKGVIKKTKLSMFKNPKKTGIVAIKLDDGDKLIGVRITDGKRELGIATKAGQAIRFSEEKLRSMGRNARGVRGMTLASEDEVRSVVVVGEDGPTLLTVCERGYGKRTPIEDYRITNRGGKGIINIKTTERNGKVVAVVAVRDDDEVILVTSSGKLIRTRCTDIPSIGRNTQGVRLIRVDEGEKVVAVARVVKGEEAGEVATPVESLDQAAIDAAKKADAAEKIEEGPAPTDDGEDGGEDGGEE